MKRILFVLLTVISAAIGAVNNVNDISDIIDQARSLTQTFSSGSLTRRMKGLTSRDFELCVTEEASYYNNTAISTAQLDFFFFTAPWKDPEFDLDEFFNEMNFSSECTAMGGEVYEIDFTVECPDLVTIEGFKLCRPPSCDDNWQYLINKDLMLLFLGMFLQCTEVKLITDLIPSGQCLLGIMDVYTEDFTDFLPEAFLQEEGMNYIEVSMEL